MNRARASYRKIRSRLGGKKPQGSTSTPIESTPKTTSSPVPKLWILSSWKDLLLFVATPVLIIPLVTLAKLRFSVEEISLYVAAFGATGHHLPGMMRAYGDRDLFQRYRIRFILSPLFLLAACMLFAHWDLAGLSVVVLLWGFWHGLAQVYGFLRIYDAKALLFTQLTARLDMLMCVAWFGAGLLYSPGRMVTVLETFYKSGGPLLPASDVHAFQTAWSVGTTAVTVAFLAHLLGQWRRGQKPNPIKLVLMISSFSFWWYAMVSINNAILGVALFEVFHDVQYLSIVWVYNHRRAESVPGVGSFTQFLFRRGGLMIGLYVGLVFGYGYIGLVPELIDQKTITHSLFGLLSASSLLHFYYDGFIWKVREKSTRQGLGLTGGQDLNETSSGMPGWQVHGLRWNLFIIPLFFLGRAQFQGQAPTLDQYRNLVALAPGNTEAHGNLGSALLAEGKQEEAIAHYRQAIQIRSDVAETHYNLGVALASKGQFEESIRHYLQALEIKPDFVEAQRKLGNALSEQGKSNEAIAHYRQALRVKPDYVKAHSDLGAELRSQGKLKEAIHSYRQVLQIDPDLVETHYNLGVALGSQGKLKEAIAHYRQALRVKPDYAEAHSNLGAELQSKGKLEEAVHHYRQALEIKPDLAEAHNNLAITLRSQGKLKEAIRSYREALKIKPDYVEAHYNLGIALRSQGKLEEAIHHYRQALEGRPELVEAHYKLGTALRSQGKLEKAHYHFGRALSGQSKAQAAIHHYRQALKGKPYYAEAHHHLGTALTMTGRIDEALGHLREAVRLQPDWTVPLINLAHILAARPDSEAHDEAIRLAERAAELTKYQDTAILDTLATARAAKQNYSQKP